MQRGRKREAQSVASPGSSIQAPCSLTQPAGAVRLPPAASMAGARLLGPRHRWRGPPPLPPGRPGRPEGAAASLEVWRGRGLPATRSTAFLLRDPPCFVAQAPDGPPGGLGARGGALHRGVAGACGHLPQRRPQAQAFPPAHVGAAPLCLQRRLGLPLLAAAAAADGARRSRSGKLFDVLGDVAASDGEAGHATRHFLINTSIYDALRRVYGGQLRREPDNYHGYHVEESGLHGPQREGGVRQRDAQAARVRQPRIPGERPKGRMLPCRPRRRRPRMARCRKGARCLSWKDRATYPHLHTHTCTPAKRERRA